MSVSLAPERFGWLISAASCRDLKSLHFWVSVMQSRQALSLSAILTMFYAPFSKLGTLHGYATKTFLVGTFSSGKIRTLPVSKKLLYPPPVPGNPTLLLFCGSESLGTSQKGNYKGPCPCDHLKPTEHTAQAHPCGYVRVSFLFKAE